MNSPMRLSTMMEVPFDSVDMQQTVSIIDRAISDRRRLFFSTPNVNWLVLSHQDKDFLKSIWRSDLCLCDGTPISLLSKLTNVEIDRVQGSTLFAHLDSRELPLDRRIKVFFFGGQDGVAEKAMQRLNNRSLGLNCVGAISPGFGTVEDLSRPEFITEINNSGADFLVVSLGAKKGQSWIEQNKDKIETPVVSHLGAVVNFYAGEISRAPKKWQDLGIEWLWRILMEPKLAKRYTHDGLILMRLMLSMTIRSAVNGIRRSFSESRESFEHTVKRDGINLTYHFKGKPPRVLPPSIVQKFRELERDTTVVPAVETSELLFDQNELSAWANRFSHQAKARHAQSLTQPPNNDDAV